MSTDLFLASTCLSGKLTLSCRPQGVGSGRDPPVWLKDGDVVEVGLEGVGTCVNKVRHSKARAHL